MEVIRVFDGHTPDVIRSLADALATWEYELPIPTDDTRCLGFILEQSIAIHTQEFMHEYRIELGGSVTYPNLHIHKPGGPSIAVEVKASPRTVGIGNRVKSPESILSFYDRFDAHWVIAIFYDFTEDRRYLHDFRICLLELWRYASTTFKDMSAVSALGSLDAMRRRTPTERAFADETEFLDFVRHMSTRPGTTAQRNAHAREWLARRRGSNSRTREAR